MTSTPRGRRPRQATSVFPASPTEAVAEVASELVAEFRGLLPADVVQTEIAMADRELCGQILPAALAELLHRLARYRLEQRVQRTD